MSDEQQERGGAGDGPELNQHEERDVERRSPPSTEVVYETIRRKGDAELARATPTLALDGLTAGLSMGFSLVAEGLLRAHLPDTSWRPAVAKLGYTVGFLIIVLGRQQLFTENTLTVILPLLQRRNLQTLLHVLRLWAVVLAANLVGALAFALVVGHSALFAPDVRHAFIDIGHEAIAGSFAHVLLRGVFAGWLIATMVWMLPAADSARFWVVIVMTWLVAFGGFSHVVAGSVEVLHLVTTGNASWAVFCGWIVPTLLGNIIGGSTVVAVLGHAQIASEARSKL